MRTMRTTNPEERVGKTHGFRMEGAPNFRGTCKITGVLETADNGNHIYSAELVAAVGDRSFWTGGILESELEQ